MEAIAKILVLVYFWTGLLVINTILILLFGWLYIAVFDKIYKFFKFHLALFEYYRNKRYFKEWKEEQLKNGKTLM